MKALLPFFLPLALPLMGKGGQAPPKILFQDVRDAGDFGNIELRGLDASTLQSLKRQSRGQKEWQELLSVKVLPDSAIDTLPNLAGSYRFIGDGIRFTPRFPPAHGITLVARYSPPTEAQGLTKSFTLPEAPAAAPTTVAAIYPSGNRIPENTLRLYVHFTAPMQRGRVAENIYLLDEDGQRVELSFLTGPIGELWDARMRRLTLLLEPGRIKRGVGPNRRLGPALAKGAQRTLVIAADIRDARGAPLGEEFRKTFAITDPVHAAIDPTQWKVASPPAGTTSAVHIRFPGAIDHGMLGHALQVIDPDGNYLAGKAIVSDSETEWSFAPSRPWRTGKHQIVVATILEDVSGNNLQAALDVPVNTSDSRPHLETQAQRVQLPFTPFRQADR